MTDQITETLAGVALAMPLIIGALHAARAITTRLRAYALTTPETWDDRAVSRALRFLDAADAIVDAVSMVVPRPPARLNPTPSLERVEAESTSPETPSARSTR